MSACAFLCLLVLFINIIAITGANVNANHPNILFMLADDVGYNDVGYHSSTDTQTPFIDALVQSESLILDSHYAAPICSQTRSALLTGRYPARMGLQSQVFQPLVDYALTRQVSFLANEFQSGGYRTHAIGKWGISYQSQEYS